MNEYTCKYCNETKPETEFYSRSKRRCKTCCYLESRKYIEAFPEKREAIWKRYRAKPEVKERLRDRMRQWRAENPEKDREKSRASHARHRKEDLARQLERQRVNREAVNKLKAFPCQDCENSFPSYVMDFDHVRGEKLGNVSSMCNNRPLTMIMKEIEKCDLVCANCHRERTQKRFPNNHFVYSS